MDDNKRVVETQKTASLSQGKERTPGAENNRAGRITEITHQAGTEQRFYGKLGEMVKEVDTFNFDPSQHFTAETFVTRAFYLSRASTTAGED